MSARDATTLRQVSLAALLGIDARPLLASDDAATRIAYDRVIEQAREWAVARSLQDAKNHAIETGNMLAEFFGGKKRSG